MFCYYNVKSTNEEFKKKKDLDVDILEKDKLEQLNILESKFKEKSKRYNRFMNIYLFIALNEHYFEEFSDKVSVKVGVIGKKGNVNTIVKAPIAHKKWSKEQIGFYYKIVIVTVRVDNWYFMNNMIIKKHNNVLLAEIFLKYYIKFDFPSAPLSKTIFNIKYNYFLKFLK